MVMIAFLKYYLMALAGWCSFCAGWKYASYRKTKDRKYLRSVGIQLIVLAFSMYCLWIYRNLG